MRRQLCLAFFLPALAAGPDAAGQDGGRGRELALRWCAGCHLIDRSAAAGAANGIPTFPSLSSKSVEQLEAAMNPQHSRMPDLALSKRQQDNLAAYIKSLSTN